MYSSTKAEFGQRVQMRFQGIDVMPIKSFDFSSFISANPEKSVSGIDYLHAIYKTQRIDGDFLVWFARLFWPEFKVVDGLVFVASLFDDDQYREIVIGGKTAERAQYWVNLLEITGLFDELTQNQARELADVVAATWNSKMLASLGEVKSPALVIEDASTGEVFVTIGTAE